MEASSKASAAIVAVSVLAGCAPSRESSLKPIDRYIDQQTEFAIDHKRYASRFGALAGDNMNAVEIVPNRIAPGLQRIVDGKFNGTVEELTKKVAALLDYKVAAEGEKPPSPIRVVIQQYNLTALGLLREGFAQARTRATLKIDQRNRVLKVIYKRPESSPVSHQDDEIL